MDIFEKITLILLILTGLTASIFNHGFFAAVNMLVSNSWLFAGIHFLYLYFVFKDLSKNELSKIWLFVVAFTADIGAIMYSIRRRM
jgi:hypothetical protein